MALALPFKGETTCSVCERWAYYRVDGSVRCGYHSDKKTRKSLKRNPRKDELLKAKGVKHLKTCVAGKKRGKVELHRLRGLYAKNPFRDGYITVFPNFGNKSGKKRVDGALSMGDLSPKTIGPVEHGQPGLPVAQNIENFHQGSKRFPDQTEEQFVETRLEMYKDPVPHRHNPFAKRVPGKNRNIPRYFAWVDKSGKEHQLSYVQSRQFYCHFLERAVKETKDFKELQDKLANGYNLLLCGWDAEPMKRSAEEEYLNPETPFGHERVLYCMLKEEYPWRKHKSFEY